MVDRIGNAVFAAAFIAALSLAARLNTRRIILE